MWFLMEWELGFKVEILFSRLRVMSWSITMHVFAESKSPLIHVNRLMKEDDARGFIEQEDSWLVWNSTCNGDSLLFSTGELCRDVIQTRAHSNLIQECWEFEASDDESRIQLARRSRPAAFFSPARTIGRQTFSWALNELKRLNVWNTNPLTLSKIKKKVRLTAFSIEGRRGLHLMCCCRFLWDETDTMWRILCPHKWSSPLVGLSIVPIMLSKVVFPPPDNPNTTTNSPCLILRETPL